jgi:hypothetical protein
MPHAADSARRRDRNHVEDAIDRLVASEDQDRPSLAIEWLMPPILTALHEL